MHADQKACGSIRRPPISGDRWAPSRHTGKRPESTGRAATIPLPSASILDDLDIEARTALEGEIDGSASSAGKSY
jgi:hypothetical protein